MAMCEICNNPDHPLHHLMPDMHKQEEEAAEARRLAAAITDEALGRLPVFTQQERCIKCGAREDDKHEHRHVWIQPEGALQADMPLLAAKQIGSREGLMISCWRCDFVWCRATLDSETT